MQRLLTGILIGHFGVLAALDVAIWLEITNYTTYGRAFVVLKSLTACALLAGLVWFSMSGGEESLSRKKGGDLFHRRPQSAL